MFGPIRKLAKPKVKTMGVEMFTDIMARRLAPCNCFYRETVSDTIEQIKIDYGVECREKDYDKLFEIAKKKINKLRNA